MTQPFIKYLNFIFKIFSKLIHKITIKIFYRSVVFFSFTSSKYTTHLF